MTRKEFYEKYGSVKVKFSSYYKFSFCYHGTLPDGKRIKCYFGETCDDIYRHSVDTDKEITISELEPSDCYIYQGDEIVEKFRDY